jgi:hypothetical protein
MPRKLIVTVVVMASFAMLALTAAARPASSKQEAQKENNDAAKKPESKSLTKLHIAVTAGNPAAPVQAAHVDVTSEEAGVDYHKIVVTDHDGVADIEVPRGRILIQVTAQHFEISGDRRTLTKATETVDIKLVKRSPTEAPPGI